MNLRYTLCFIRKDGRILMLHRKYPPNAGALNGVGGKIKSNETPEEANRREVFEETGIALRSARFGGIVTWEGDTGREGMYVFIADLPQGYETCGSGEETDEGTLYWIAENHACNNLLIVDNIPHFLPPMLRGEEPAEYRCIYDEDGLRGVERLTLDLEMERRARERAEERIGRLLPLARAWATHTCEPADWRQEYGASTP